MEEVLQDHKARAHALLSASAADRWIHCPESVMLTKDMPDSTSPFAEEGTKAHEIAQAAIDMWLKGIDYTADCEEDEDTKRIHEEVQPYVDRAIEDFMALQVTDPTAEMLTEIRVSFDKWVSDGFGTSDLVILSDDTLYIRDLKFGKGVEVSAKGNPQLRCYALGCYEKFKCLYDIDKVVMQIDQPRIHNFSEDTISVSDLLKWADEELAPKAQLAVMGLGGFEAGSWCRFCKAAATCRTRAKHFLDLDPIMKANESIDLLSNSEIADILDRAEGIETWCKALKDYATAQSLEGIDIPGWKAVEGRSARKIRDENDATKKLVKAGFKRSDLYTKSLIGIPAMEKLVGKSRLSEILDGDIIKTAGKPTLVRADDKREAIHKSAENDFKDIKMEEN